MTTVAPPTSKIELRFSCKNLKNMDLLSKSDPQIYVFHQRRGGEYQLVGRTEKINNNLHPTFKTPIAVEYYFEDVQNLKFIVVDVDHGHSYDLKDQDFIGELCTTLGSIVSQPGCTLVKDIKSKHGHVTGSIQISAEEIKSTGHNIKIRLGGHKFDKKDLFGKSDPYFTISKISTAAGYQVVFTSEVKKNTLDPEWQEVFLKLEDLNGGDMNRPLKFEFFDFDSIGKHDVIGEFQTTAAELVGGKNQFEVINIKKQQKKKDYKNSGVVHVHNASLCRDYSFLDYLVGGCEINLMVAIDCTGSNGDPTSPHSLHFKHPTEPNEYAKAIVSVGNVLAPYDADGLIAVYGFGGVIPGRSGVNHCFPMSLNQETVQQPGIAKVLDTYYQNITTVDFSGPTYFAPIINNAATFASQSQSQQNQKYTILLIITDGEICDMENTIDAIIRASSLPLSIVIVGVGSSDFSNMVTLDGDNGALTNGRVRAERDIVQFVPFRQFKDLDFQLLASETLREIPTQFLSFFKKIGYVPNPPRVYQPQIIPQPPVSN